MRIIVAAALIFGEPALLVAHQGPHAPVGAGSSAWDIAILAGLCGAAALYEFGLRQLR
jgi:hypothetical protein